MNDPIIYTQMNQDGTSGTNIDVDESNVATSTSFSLNFDNTRPFSEDYLSRNTSPYHLRP